MQTIEQTVIPKRVDAVREEFKAINNLLPRNWKKLAAQINPYFNTREGLTTINTVVSNRGRLEKTEMVLEVAKQILATKTTAPKTTKSLERMNIVSGYQPKYDTTKKLQEKFKKNAK